MAQPFYFSILQKGPTNISYYHLVNISNNVVQAVGENTGLTTLSFIKNKPIRLVEQNIKAPSQIYRITTMDTNTAYLCDSGKIILSNKTTPIQLQGPSNELCIYNGVTYGRTYYCNTFNKQLMAKKRVLPNGRLFAIQNNIPVQISYSWRKLIWDMYVQQDSLKSMLYNGLSSTIQYLDTTKKRWHSIQKFKGLLYKHYSNDSITAYCGATNYKLQHGQIIINNKKFVLQNSGMIWDVTVLNNYIIALADNGTIYYKTMDATTFTALKILDKNLPLYSVVVNNGSLIIGTSGGYLLQLTDNKDKLITIKKAY